MPRVGEMKNSKFLKKEDVGEDGVVVTIKDVDQVNVAMEGKKDDLKWCMFFREFEKPMVLNSTNAQLCEKFLGSDNTDDWIGKKIVIYDEPNVSFGGELVGGIRVRRASAGQAARPAPSRPAPPADQETDPPWPEE